MPFAKKLKKFSDFSRLMQNPISLHNFTNKDGKNFARIALKKNHFIYVFFGEQNFYHIPFYKSENFEQFLLMDCFSKGYTTQRIVSDDEEYIFFPEEWLFHESTKNEDTIEGYVKMKKFIERNV